VESTGIGWAEEWRRYLDEFRPSARHAHERHAIRVCRLALESAHVGSYGVGAVLVDGDGETLVEGHNEVYLEGFRSDLHAEMVVMNEYEGLGLPRERARDLTLVTSLEPCPMCMTRLIVAGVGSVLHVSDDSAGGMVQRKHGLPPVFRTITEHQRQVWGPAECSEELRVAAFRIWMESRDRLEQGAG
jgi:cytosine deaminase